MLAFGPSLEVLQCAVTAILDWKKAVEADKRLRQHQYWTATEEHPATLDVALQEGQTHQHQAHATTQRLKARLQQFERTLPAPNLNGLDPFDLHLIPDLTAWTLTVDDFVCAAACLYYWRWDAARRGLVLYVLDRLAEMPRDPRSTPQERAVIHSLYHLLTAPLEPPLTKIGMNSQDLKARISLDALLKHYERELLVVQGLLQTCPETDALSYALHMRYEAYTQEEFRAYITQTLELSETRPPRVRADYLTMLLLAPAYGIKSLQAIQKALTRARTDRRRQGFQALSAENFR